MRTNGAFGLPPGIRSFVNLSNGSNPTIATVLWVHEDTFGDKFIIGKFSTGEQWISLKESGVYDITGEYATAVSNDVCIAADITNPASFPGSCRIPHESGARILASSTSFNNGRAVTVSSVCWLPAGTRIMMIIGGATSSAAQGDDFYLRISYLGP